MVRKYVWARYEYFISVFELQWKPISVITVYCFNCLWSQFKAPFNKDWLVYFIAYCYHSVNVITLAWHILIILSGFYCVYLFVHFQREVKSFFENTILQSKIWSYRIDRHLRKSKCEIETIFIWGESKGFCSKRTANQKKDDTRSLNK